jgi:hypothetical protein
MVTGTLGFVIGKRLMRKSEEARRGDANTSVRLAYLG